jgi:hypothetical protein
MQGFTIFLKMKHIISYKHECYKFSENYNIFKILHSAMKDMNTT